MNPLAWHDKASEAAMFCGVADDRITEALRGQGLSPDKICRILDEADAALAVAQRRLTDARAHAGALRMMED